MAAGWKGLCPGDVGWHDGLLEEYKAAVSREMARRSKTVRHNTLFRAVSPKPTLPPNHILNRKPNPKTLTPTQTAPLTP